MFPMQTNSNLYRRMGGSLSARLAKGRQDGNTVLLSKPQGYMNLSGQSVAPLAQYYQIPNGRVMVVVDDLDLPPTPGQAPGASSTDDAGSDNDNSRATHQVTPIGVLVSILVAASLAARYTSSVSLAQRSQLKDAAYSRALASFESSWDSAWPSAMPTSSTVW